MFNPTKYPYGKGGLKTPRDAKLTMQRYFNQRLLDVDGRFGKDIEYLLTEQYTVEDTSTQLREHRHAPDTGKMPQRSRCSHGGFCKEQDIDGGADDILSVAPSEGNHPRASPRTSSLKRCLTPPSTRTVKAA